MLTKSLHRLRFQIVSVRCFSSEKMNTGSLKDDFRFPQHREFVNDHYYEQPEDPSRASTFGKDSEGAFSRGED